MVTFKRDLVGYMMKVVIAGIQELPFSIMWWKVRGLRLDTESTLPFPLTDHRHFEAESLMECSAKISDGFSEKRKSSTS